MTMFVSPVQTAVANDAVAPRRGLRIVEETPADIAAREALLDAAFGPERFVKTCERLREGCAPARGLALVAREAGALVGTIRLWNIVADSGCAALLLGPVAVADAHRSRGVGAALVREALRRARMRGHKAVILVGDAPYYERFGFSRAHTLGLEMPGPVEAERFLGLELVEGALRHARGMLRAAAPRRARIAALPQAA
jgi:predicted N-acetyltransferase YhbS